MTETPSQRDLRAKQGRTHMPGLATALAVMLALMASPISAQSPSGAGTADLSLTGIRLPSALDSPSPRPRASQPAPSWIERHPVLFGAIVGSVAGAVIVGATYDLEASPAGFYGGGAVGALVGWVVSR